MSALAMAMMLTGAGAIDAAPRRRETPVAPPLLVVPPPPPFPPVPAPSPPPPRLGIPAQRARANLSSYFSGDDYPAAALRADEEGLSGFHLDIGPDGRVIGCSITQSSGSAALDQATCRILTSRARFTPARDAYGNPTYGTDNGRVRWRLPEQERFGIPDPETPARALALPASYVRAADYPLSALRAREQGFVWVQLVIGVDGRVIACGVSESNVSPTLQAAACRLLRVRARYLPARDAGGGAACDVTESRIAWTLPARRRIPRGRAAPPAAAPPPVEAQLAPGICPGRAP